MLTLCARSYDNDNLRLSKFDTSFVRLNNNNNKVLLISVLLESLKITYINIIEYLNKS